MTRAEAVLEFSGFLGPLLTLIRSAGNGPHLEQILGDIRDLAESEEFYEDGDDGDDLNEPERTKTTRTSRSAVSLAASFQSLEQERTCS